MSVAEGAGLVANDLVTGYESSRGETVVTRASFTIEAGTIVAVVGPNGSGKTTLLKTLIGLLNPLAGSATICGLAPAAYRARFGIGYLPEQLVLPVQWTGRGMLALAAAATAGRQAVSDIEEAIQIAGVDFDLGLPLAKLSKGMRQRVAIAMALVPLPHLLLLDEPEAGLDPAQRVLLRDRIRQFARAGRIVLVASHDITGLCSIADHVFLLRDGRMQTIERAELASAARVVELFGSGSAS